MKKIILSVIMLTLLSLPVFTFATYITDKSYRLQISDGWNIVYNFWGPDFMNDISGMSKDSIKAVYGLDPTNQEYVRFYPKPETDKIFNGSFAWDDYSPMSAFLVYSNKDGMMTYVVPEATDEIFPLNERQLIRGWNFIGITKDFSGYSFNQLKGNCEVIKVGTFDIATDSWDMMTESQTDQEVFKEDTIYEVGRGMVVKVANDCKLGKITKGNINVIPPPQIPN